MTRSSETGVVEDLRAENQRLRAALARSDQPCAYCTLPAAEWAKCASGFPGCDRADDAMGCPELGASMRATTAERERDEALAALREKEEALSKAQRTIGHRDRRIARLWAAIEDARAKGYRLPVEEEPPVVLSSAERPCPHAPTYDAGLCCGHPDDCTFIAPVSREQRGEEA